MAVITHKILDWKTNTFLKSSKINRASINYADAKQIGILFTVVDKKKHAAIKNFIRQLENEGKKVTVLSYLGKDKENYEFRFDFFTENDISFWGNFNIGSVINFVEKKFDYLFHLDLEPNNMIENILARSKAKCRIGNYRNDKNDFYELMVRPENDDVNKLIEQMHHYTKKLSEG